MNRLWKHSYTQLQT